MNKPRVLFVVNFLICVSFFVKGQEKNVVYSDSSTSKMVVTKLDSTGDGIAFSIIETKYSIEYLTINGETAFFAVKKTSLLDGNNANMARNGILHHLIIVDFTPINSNLKSFSMKFDCDDIELHFDFCETITYNCCGGTTRITYYSYSTRKEIGDGLGGIMSYSIPNGKITCYIGFVTKSNSLLDTAGALCIGYNTGEFYKIKILSSFISPEIKIVTGNPKDEIRDNYENTSIIYSLDKIHSVNQINNLKISVNFSYSKGGYPAEGKVVDIPIINGKPFGNDVPEQEYRIPK